MQNPKSKIPKIRPKKFGFWILGILDFGFWGFWILGFWGFWILDFRDFGDLGFWDFGDSGFWILGILGILDFGFWDFGDLGFWILGILGILDFGFSDFRILGILDFGDFGDFGFSILGFWGGPGDVPLGNLATVPGGQRLESPLVCLWGPLQNQLYLIELGQGSKLNFFQRSGPYKITEKPWLPTQRSELYKITEKPRLPTHFKTNLNEPSDHTPENRRKLKK